MRLEPRIRDNILAKKKTTKKKTTKKKTTKKAASKKRNAVPDATGKHLVIVESPAKARTINKYLGDDYAVTSSVGHIRDLPARAPKGSKQPVPGVDLENDFKPTYEVLKGKNILASELKKAAKVAKDIWFASDLDREGEAIAWHLAELLEVDPTKAKRVIFNAITKKQIQEAFEHPHPINMDFVDAQQSRRILDRIVGYKVSPLLWKRVAGGLSAGRVQSVAVRIIVEREKEIEAHIPDETWSVAGRFTLDASKTSSVKSKWNEFLATKDERGKGPTRKQMNAFLAEHGSIEGTLVELGGKSFKVSRASDCNDIIDTHKTRLIEVGKAVGLADPTLTIVEDEEGRGPAKHCITLNGELAEGVSYKVNNITQKDNNVRPPAPFITSSLQASASTVLGFGAKRTMRAAQALYEGISIKGEGQVGLITYMRTDSTHLSGDALTSVRTYIGNKFGEAYLPAKPNFYASANQDAQEAHEAIRPTEAGRHPDTLPASIDEDQRRLYKLIWSRFVACQMMPARWHRTEFFFEREDEATGAIFKVGGRTLAFDGFYKASGVPSSDTEQNLPVLKEEDVLYPFDITPKQNFSSPPSRYSEASLIKKLESEGIGRPSTYASIIDVIQYRKYVEKIDRSFHPTDLGEVVTEKLIEAFPVLMGVEYTRSLEQRLDSVAKGETNWVAMLHDFYGRFSKRLETAYEEMPHAKAETKPAIYKCPACGSRTEYRFGKNGRFLSCTSYPDCKYAAPIDRKGQPLLPERVDVACPEDGSAMEKRTGRFGPFLASVNYPEIKTVVNLDKKGGIKYPSPPALLIESLICEKCESPMNLRHGKRGPWLGCSTFPKCKGRMGWKTLEDDVRDELDAALNVHMEANPQIIITTMSGKVIPEGTPIEDLLIEGNVVELEVFAD
ncbi:MAG TPA: type I DNA topoisomerase [Phycisphaerales bacterium]|nr:type I DNA topoisomerase [Phycisphaerales bacterium]HIN83581.1 type I DNA topoisomerase [Phycisphaerales bacterium]